MKNKLLLFGIIFFCLQSFSQNRAIDSLSNLLKHATDDTGNHGKDYFLCKLAIEYQYFRPDTALFLSKQAFKLAVKKNDLDVISRSSNIIGTVYNEAGNYPKALEYFIQKLKIEETGKDPEMLAGVLLNIALVYTKETDYNKAFFYAFKADSIINKNNIKNLRLFFLLNIGDMYEKSGETSPALEYSQKAYALALKEDNILFKGAALNNLGNIYAKMGNTTLAIQHYKNALPFLESITFADFIAESSIGLAKQYLLLDEPDSALYYGVKSLKISKENGLLGHQLDASILLTSFYKMKHDLTNAFAYQENVLVLKDSIFSKERIAKSQFLSIEEELRQKDIAEKKIEEEAERKVKLQYLTIGLLLPIFFLITLFLSNRKIKPKYIEFLGVVSLLLTFEFIMLLLHPVIVSFSNYMPLYELIIFAVIASVLTPVHQKIEGWLLKILTQKERLSLMKIRID